jgi:hypothetical protein
MSHCQVIRDAVAVGVIIIIIWSHSRDRQAGERLLSTYCNSLVRK